MKRANFVWAIQLFATTLLLSVFLLSQSKPFAVANSSAGVVSAMSTPADAKTQGNILDSYGRLPLSFEVNHGQSDARVKFLSRTGGYSLFLTADEAVLTFGEKKSSPQGLKPASLTGLSAPFPKSAPGAILQQAGMGRASSLQKKERTQRQIAGGVLRMKVRGANPAAQVTGLDEMAGTSNYFIGNDPAKWRTHVPTYAKVKYEGIYSGIDLVYYGNQRQLEYDFIVAPGADPRRIAMDVRGAKRIRRDGKGDLVFKVGGGQIRWHKPVAYQEKDGTRQLVAASYAITNTNRVAFEVAKYDAHRTLYIDPLIYSTYLGGSGDDRGSGIAVDGAGNAYVTGITDSTDFPTNNPFQPFGGGSDVFVTKINPSGTALVYSTYLGGSAQDGGSGVALDSEGNAYVTGFTQSLDFPVTPGAFQMTLNGSESAFVTEINATGSALVYSTYLGGTSPAYANGIAVDSSGSTYVVGDGGSGFPVTTGAFQTGPSNYLSPFVSKLNSAGSALVYSTFVDGGAYYNTIGNENGAGIAVDNSGNAYIVGSTESPSFPVTPGAFQTVCNGIGHYYQCVDAFVTKLNANGSGLVYSTFLGGEGGSRGNHGVAIAVDSSGNAYVTGQTASWTFPLTPGAFQTAYHSHGDAFVTKFNSTGSALIYSTYLGGGGYDQGQSIAVDGSGNAYVTGVTNSPQFPTTPGSVQPACALRNNECENAFVTEVDPTGTALVYSTFLGGKYFDLGLGLALDSANNVYVTGVAGSANFPVTSGAFQTTSGGKQDAFVSKIYMPPVTATLTTLSSSPNPSNYGEAVTFTAVVTSSVGAPPDGEAVTFRIGPKKLGMGLLSGGSATFTTSTLKAGFNRITATYLGDSNFGGSRSNTVVQFVEKGTN
jgi:hypothetical protein